MIDRPDRVRELAERLIAIPSASPDVEAETRCARAIAEALPARLERGEWRAPDGRPALWALARGASPRTVVLLGHYDTVGIRDFAAAGAEALAFRPRDLAAFHARRIASGEEASALLRDDLDAERRRPGTWCFGRGALDMKSAIAAGIAALDAIVERRPPGGALLIATPDEEHLSEGMRAAVRALPGFAAAKGLELVGAINLDYALEPALHSGVAGKIELGGYVLGEAAHIADPSRGKNAIEIASRIVLALTEPGATPGPGVPAVLGLDDLRAGYSIEPPSEALVEFSVRWDGGSLAALLERIRGTIGAALGDRVAIRLASELLEPGSAGAPEASGATRGEASPGLPAASRHEDAPEAVARAASLEELRRRCARAGLGRPAVVLHLLPPLYPPIPRGAGAFTRAAEAWAEREGISVRGPYPFISDASYVAWHAEDGPAIGRELLGLGAGYDLPIAEARALGLEVVNLGPWGRDAHRPSERVHAPYAFERLPGLITGLVEAALVG